MVQMYQFFDMFAVLISESLTVCKWLIIKK